MPKVRSNTHQSLILYQRDDCHLCEQALAVLAQAQAPEFSSVFIDNDAALEARYGSRVPVLHDMSSRDELDWPFTVQSVHYWLHAKR